MKIAKTILKILAWLIAGVVALAVVVYLVALVNNRGRARIDFVAIGPFYRGTP